jgi:short-subunit dehydrogenase
MTNKKYNAIITGGSRGIGLAIAEKLLANNFNVIICSKNGERLNNTIQNLQHSYPNAIIVGFEANLAIKQEVMKFAQFIIQQFAEINLLVNNAGMFVPGQIATEPDTLLEELLATNLMSAYYLTKQLIPLFINQKHGHIFNISSVAGLQAYNNGGAYSISKFALTGFSKNLRAEMMPYGIKVTTVYPGAVYTSSWHGSDVLPERIMQSNDISELILTCYNLSSSATVEDILIRPTLGDL